jgi:phosphate transport system permease protein
VSDLDRTAAAGSAPGSTGVIGADHVDDWVWNGTQWQRVRDSAPEVRPGERTGALVPDVPEVSVVEDRPRRPRSLFKADFQEFAVAAVAAVSLAMCLRLLLDWTHPLTLSIWAAIGFVVIEYVQVRSRLGHTAASDRLVTCLVWLTGLIAAGVLAWMITYLVIKGLGAIDWGFFTQDMSKTGPLNPGGGSLHAIIGTLEQTAIATAFAVPLGVLTAVYLNEMKGRLSPVVRFFSDAMSGLPSIVAGLLVYTLWVSGQGGLHRGFSGLAASFALVIVMLPIVTRTAEEVLRTVDHGLRESSLALGSPQWRSVTRVVLPTARSGIVTASILAIARVVGETAPLLLTAFGSARINANPLQGPQEALPFFVYQLIREPNNVQVQRAWTGALVLVMVVLVLFVIARVISSRGDKLRKGGR